MHTSASDSCSSAPSNALSCCFSKAETVVSHLLQQLATAQVAHGRAASCHFGTRSGEKHRGIDAVVHLILYYMYPHVGVP